MYTIKYQYRLMNAIETKRIKDMTKAYEYFDKICKNTMVQKAVLYKESKEISRFERKK